MSVALRQMTIEDVKTLLSHVSDDSALKRDLAENPDRVTSSWGFYLSAPCAAFLAEVSAAGQERPRAEARPAFWA